MSNKRRGIVIVVLALVLLALTLFWVLVYQPWSERKKYPALYSKEILSACQEFSIDPYLMTALVQRESSFRAEVQSKATAVGLAQIMPETGAWIASKVGITLYEPAMLKDPLVNLRMAAWYLQFLMERYDGQTVEALTAYNQGQGAVDAWLADPLISPDGKTLVKGEDGATLVNLPPHIKDGRVYASLILAARDHYQKLYPNLYASDD